MKARCYKVNSNNYKYYGAKGVTVCERWHDFWNFVEDVDHHIENGHLLYKKEYELDKDLKGGGMYSLENCVILTSEENRQIGRQKQKKSICAINKNETLRFSSASEASKMLKINRGSIQQYVKSGRIHSSGYLFEYS